MFRLRLPRLAALASTPLLAVVFSSLFPLAAEEGRVTANECSFLVHQDEFLSAQSRIREDVHARALKLERKASSRAATVDPSSIPRRNLIDVEIFDKLVRQGVPSAPLTTDEEFLRRVTLDLTGRIPSVADIREFAASTDLDKRNAWIDKLINSPEFTAKWTWWLSDLLQVNANNSNVNRQINGRNAYHLWVKVKMEERASLKDIAYEAVTASGSNFMMETGASNFVVGSITPGGPIQDQYDTMLSKSATAFLGLGYYDCILCHNGRGRLEQLSLWGRGATRMEAQRMAAFFSRQDVAIHPEFRNTGSFYVGSYVVSDRAAGEYALNTTNGNRPARCAPEATVSNNRCSMTMVLQPEYHVTGSKPAEGQTWREAFAQNMVADPMLARNFANRLWKEMFSLGLVDPVDTMDPARLDPNNPPPAPWTLQATHPVLLESLAAELRRNNYDLRAFLKLIASSSAYQLSSRYPGEWKIEYVPLFARRYPRRLEGEEVHDAIVKATGSMASYTVQNFPAPVSWAMELPDPSEPRSNTGVLAFLNAFLRGNRDTQQRNQSGSILQQLYLMNDNVVLSRNKVTSSANLRALANNSNNEQVIEEMFLLFLGRKPVPAEHNEVMNLLAKSTSQAMRNAAVEDLAWALINKTEFLFSY
jgi:hypothetical protein